MVILATVHLDTGPEWLDKLLGKIQEEGIDNRVWIILGKIYMVV